MARAPGKHCHTLKKRGEEDKWRRSDRPPKEAISVAFSFNLRFIVLLLYRTLLTETTHRHYNFSGRQVTEDSYRE